MKTQEEKDSEIHIKGAPVIGGIGIGHLYFWDEVDDSVPEFPITSGEVEGEIARYRRALLTSREDLKRLQEILASEGSDSAFSIIGTHIQMLDDPMMTSHMEEKIREMMKNTETVFQSVVADYEAKFLQSPDAFFQQRFADVRDLSKRVLANLSMKTSLSLKEIPFNSIIVAKELGPSAIASIQASRVSAFVTHRGGTTSHTAVIANEKNASYVYSVDPKELEKARDRYVIVDGETGEIILNPSKATLAKYERLKDRLTQQSLLLEEEKEGPVQTVDGYPISLYANINTLNDLDLMHHHHCLGVGLFRSEISFLKAKEFCLSEEMQFNLYKDILQKSRRLPFVFRLADIGGDKNIALFENLPKEPNPVLGCRGVRFLIKHKEVLRIQLRAILRACCFGDVRILIPLVSDIDEFREMKKEIELCKQTLVKEGHFIQENVSIGCMLEVPSAILICDVLARESDFLSIGTNDLAQYSLGIDRSNISMNDFYHPTHPSVIRMIKMAVLETKRWGKSISICGEIASNPLLAPLFIGLGIRSFSCAPKFIPVLKKAVRKCSLLEACEMAEKALQLTTSQEVIELLLGYSKSKRG